MHWIIGRTSHDNRRSTRSGWVESITQSIRHTHCQPASSMTNASFALRNIIQNGLNVGVKLGSHTTNARTRIDLTSRQLKSLCHCRSRLTRRDCRCRISRRSCSPQYRATIRTIGIVDQDRDAARHNIVRALDGPSPPAFSQAMRCSAVRWGVCSFGVVRGCCRHYCRQRSRPLAPGGARGCVDASASLAARGSAWEWPIDGDGGQGSGATATIRQRSASEGRLPAGRFSVLPAWAVFRGGCVRAQRPGGHVHLGQGAGSFAPRRWQTAATALGEPTQRAEGRPPGRPCLRSGRRTVVGDNLLRQEPSSGSRSVSPVTTPAGLLHIPAAGLLARTCRPADPRSEDGLSATATAVGPGERAPPRTSNLVEKIWTHTPALERPGADGLVVSLGAARFQGFDAGMQAGELIKRFGQCQLQRLNASCRPADGRVPRRPVT